jgi:hypothetical protein
MRPFIGDFRTGRENQDIAEYAVLLATILQRVRMLKAIAALLFLASTCIAQSSADGFFVVRNINKSGPLLTPGQMREAEQLYQSACAVVRSDFHGNAELRPRFTVLLGTDINQVHGGTEIWLKQWNQTTFTEGVVVLAFYQVLTGDAIKKLGKQAVQRATAIVDLAELKQKR